MKPRTLLLLASAAVIAVAGVIVAKPLYKRAKAWRAANLAQKALNEFNSGARDKAELQLRAAVQLSIKPPEVRLAIARIIGSRGDPSALEHWAAFLESPQAHPSHFWEAGQLALSTGATAQAKAFLKKLATTSTNRPPEFYRLAANIDMAEADPDAAWSNALEQVRLMPDDPEAGLLLAYAGLKSSDPDRRNRALSILAFLSKGTDPSSLTALTLMATMDDTSLVSLDRIGSNLKAHPLAGSFHIALGAELQNPVSAAENEAKLMALDLGNTPPIERHAAAAWFLGRGRPEMALRILPETLALGRQDFLLTHLDALAGTGQWEKVRAILQNPSTIMNEALRHLYLCRAFEENNTPDKARLEWQQVLASAAATRADVWSYLLFYTEKQGWNERALMVANLMAEHPITARAGLVAQLRIARKLRNTDALHEALERGIARFPGSAELRNDLAYCDLLMGRNISGATMTAHELASKDPRSLAFRITLALALLRNARPEAAMRLFDGLRIPWKNAMPHQRAIYAGVLRAAARTSEAGAIAGTIVETDLLIEESELAGLERRPAQRNK